MTVHAGLQRGMRTKGCRQGTWPETAVTAAADCQGCSVQHAFAELAVPVNFRGAHLALLHSHGRLIGQPCCAGTCKGGCAHRRDDVDQPKTGVWSRQALGVQRQGALEVQDGADGKILAGSCQIFINAGAAGWQAF